MGFIFLKKLDVGREEITMNKKALLLAIPACLLCIGLYQLSDVNATLTSPEILIAQTGNIQLGKSQEIKLVRQLIQAVEAKDINKIDQLVTENVVLEQPYSEQQSGGIRVEGRQAANAFFNRVFSQYSQIRFVDVVIRESRFDNAVIIEGKGDFIVASNQESYRNQYIFVLEVVDGQIALIREYFNPLLVPEILRSNQQNS